MYIENLKMFSVKFLKIMHKTNYMDKKINTQKSVFFSSQQIIDNRI